MISQYGSNLNNISNEVLYLHYLKIRPDLHRLVPKEYFDNKMISAIFGILKSFQKKYSQTPTFEQIRIIIDNKKYDEFYDGDKKFKIEEFRTIIDHDINLYDSDWLDVQFLTWLKIKSLDTSILNSIELLKTSNLDSSNIDIVVNKIVETIQNKNNITIDQDLGSDFLDLEKHTNLKINRRKTGFDFFDRCLDGGFGSGELVVFAGSPKSGKSMFLTDLACRSSLNGYNTLIISFEMNEPTYLRRVSCNILGIDKNEYDKMIESPNKRLLSENIQMVMKRNDELMKFNGALIIKSFPTSNANVRDIENYIKKVEESRGIKIENVFLDYINIVENFRNRNSENTYMKIKQIAEDLRATAKRKDLTIISATQLNKSSTNATLLDYSNISESHGLVATVDALFGIIPRDLNDVLNGEVRVQALALRNAELPDENLVCEAVFDKMTIREKHLVDKNQITSKKDKSEQKDTNVNYKIEKQFLDGFF